MVEERQLNRFKLKVEQWKFNFILVNDIYCNTVLLKIFVCSTCPDVLNVGYVRSPAMYLNR